MDKGFAISFVLGLTLLTPIGNADDSQTSEKIADTIANVAMSASSEDTEASI